MTAHTRRAAFTLVELLVAMSLAVVILSLAVAVSRTSTFESYKAVGAADKLSQWLLIAKQRALRDKAPRGLRLLVDPATGRATEVAYIEQPEAWTPPSDNVFVVFQQVIDEGDPTATAATAHQKRLLSTRVFLCISAGGVLNSADFQGTGQAANPNALVRPGDVLFVPELPGKGFEIVGIHDPFAGPPSPPARKYVPGSAVNPNAAATPGYSDQMVFTLNPPPNGFGVDQNTPPTYPNLSPLKAVVELELAAVPNFSPSYSKFSSWLSPPTAVPPIQAPLDPPPNMGGSGLPIELPFINLPANGGQPPYFDARYPVFTTRRFGVHRAPRPLLGEANLLLPADMAVDLTVGQPAVAANSGVSQVDILFAPSGEVISPTGGTGLYALVLRDTSKAPTVNLQDPTSYDAAGQLTLVVVYTRTGAIATQPVQKPPSLNAAGFDPFKFAKDGINTGL